MVKMQRIKKKICLAFLCVGILAGIILLIYEIFIPHIKVEEHKLYEYTLQPQLSYEVHLLKNDIYDSDIRNEDEIYIINLIDYIRINFSALYTASEIAPLDMEYELIASVIGYNSDKENRTDYWKKDFPLSEKKMIHMDSERLEQQDRIKVSLNEYNDFAKNANAVTGINLSSDLKISMVGYITANTTYGTLSAPFNIDMTIPLLGNIAIIKKGNLDSSTDKLVETYEKVLPVNITYIILTSIGTIICILLLFLSVKLIKEPSNQDILRKETDKLLKKFGSRMIMLTSSPNREAKDLYEVNSIKDLILISDDIQKPIYYIMDKSDKVKDFTYYVDDREDTYIYIHSRNFYSKLLDKLDDKYTEIIDITNSRDEKLSNEVT